MKYYLSKGINKGILNGGNNDDNPNIISCIKGNYQLSHEYMLFWIYCLNGTYDYNKSFTNIKDSDIEKMVNMGVLEVFDFPDETEAEEIDYLMLKNQVILPVLTTEQWKEFFENTEDYISEHCADGYECRMYRYIKRIAAWYSKNAYPLTLDELIFLIENDVDPEERYFEEGNEELTQMMYPENNENGVGNTSYKAKCKNDVTDVMYYFTENDIFYIF